MNEWTEHLGESRQVQEINVINTNHHCHRAFHLQAQMQKKPNEVLFEFELQQNRNT